ncbi:tyrosine phosphatase domain protein, partial [Escherichia coli PA49]
MRLYACCGLLLCPAYPQHFAHGYVDKIPGYPGRAGTLTGLHPMQVCRCRRPPH